MPKAKTIKKLPIRDEVKRTHVSKTLPFKPIPESKSFTFSFALLDRNNKLFNLGTPTGEAINGNWFFDLLDCLQEIHDKTFDELRCSKYDLHPVDWKKANTKPPENSEQLEYWQFRISKSKGRVIGAIIDNVFYIVWLDAHHNLTNSEGYGREQFYRKPKSAYEELEEENKQLKEEIELLEQACNECEGNIHKK